jgi:hypothetical protein
VAFELWLKWLLTHPDMMLLLLKLPVGRVVADDPDLPARKVPVAS